MTTTESFFSLLKSHRESKGVEIQDIAEHTKINPKYLHAIESGDFDVLPNVYMRLFLRSYAQFIDADTEQALDDFELHTTGKVSVKFENVAESIGDSLKGEFLPNEIPQILGNSPIPPKQLLTGAAVISGLFFFFNLVSNITEQQAKPPIELKEEISVKPEGLEKIKAISISPSETEINTPLPAENKESPDEDIKKKP